MPYNLSIPCDISANEYSLAFKKSLEHSTKKMALSTKSLRFYDVEESVIGVVLDFIGEPCRIRTCDPLIKSPLDRNLQGFENTVKTATRAVLEALSVVYVLSTIGPFCHVFFTILSRWLKQ